MGNIYPSGHAHTSRRRALYPQFGKKGVYFVGQDAGIKIEHTSLLRESFYWKAKQKFNSHSDQTMEMQNKYSCLRGCV